MIAATLNTPYDPNPVLFLLAVAGWALAGLFLFAWIGANLARRRAGERLRQELNGCLLLLDCLHVSYGGGPEAIENRPPPRTIAEVRAAIADHPVVAQARYAARGYDDSVSDGR